MTNLEAVPSEVVCTGEATAAQILVPRDVPLGGLRAMTVRRTLPQRDRSLIGAWCFADHYGPDDVAVTGGMAVAPHPHTGLQTVSWLFSGEIEHRDSLGSHAMVRPGELNLMTAGRGITHSEVSTPATTLLHGVQLWTALPAAAVDAPPAFEHHVPPVVELPAVGEDVPGDGGPGDAAQPAAPPARLRVFLGTLAGATSPVRTFSPLVGAELELPPGGRVDLELDPAFEHGYLVDQGPVVVDGTTVAPGELAYLPLGAARVHLAAPADRPARLLVLGGAPLGERVVMWWNFLGRSHDDVVAARAAWQAEVAGSLGRHAEVRFGPVPEEGADPLPAPELPGVKLLPRG